MAAATRKRTTKSVRSSRKGDGFLAWTVTLVGGLVLVAGGFSGGVLLGVMTEEPQLVTGHLAGRSQSVPWTVEAERAGEEGGAPDSAANPLPQVAAAPVRAVGKAVPPVPVKAKAQQASVLPSVAAQPPSGFAIQVGAFSSSEAAHAMIAKLKKQGYKSYVAAGAVARDGRWRVRIGPFTTREAADSKATRIKREQKLPTWVLSEEG